MAGGNEGRGEGPSRREATKQPVCPPYFALQAEAEAKAKADAKAEKARAAAAAKAAAEAEAQKAAAGGCMSGMCGCVWGIGTQCCQLCHHTCKKNTSQNSRVPSPPQSGSLLRRPRRSMWCLN